MDYKIKLSLCLLIGMLSIHTSSAQVEDDSVEFIKVSKDVLSMKKAKAISFNFQNAKLGELLSLPGFTYESEHHIITRNGFVYGWYFRINDRYKINIYFDKRELKEKDNTFLNEIKLDSVRNEKIKRISIEEKRDR